MAISGGRIEMKTAAIFKDGMVLQQKKKNRIWGICEEDEMITLTFDNREYDACCADGRWYVDLLAVDAGGPYEMSIISNRTGEYTIKDILVGEVWLAGGQSNMELELQNSDDGLAVCEASDYDLIRFYNVPKYAKVDDELIRLEKETKWKSATGMDIKDVSAVGYYFAKKLYEVLQVPIGIIDCYWGGTSATCWFPRGKAEEIPEVSDYIKEWDDVIATKTDEQYEEEMRAYDEDYQAWNSRVEALRAEDPDITWEIINEKAGICPWPQPMGGGSPFRPFGIYESMIKRIAPYGLKGFLYYQAEEDWSRGDYYEKLNRAVIDQWREDFSIDKKEEFPFLVTQLPMYIAKGDEDVHNFARLREQQGLVVEHTTNTGMAVLIDCGEFDNIHPTDKETPGVRLALQALGRFYEKIEKYDFMKVKDVQIIDDTAMISFSNSYGELKARYADSTTLTAQYEQTEVEAKVLPPERIMGFELSEDGKNYYPAKAIVVGEKLKICSDKVNDPKAVRYGYFDYGVVNVYNAIGLPLAPFRWNKEER